VPTVPPDPDRLPDRQSGRARGGGLPPLPPGLAVRVPDDLSELADEVAAVRRELGLPALAPAEPPRDPLLGVTGGWARRFPGSLVLAAVSVVAVLGCLLALLTPTRSVRTPTAAPLARPSAADGRAGGLVPAAPVWSGRRPLNVRDLRPGVLVLPPAGCRCAGEIRQIIGQAQEFRLRTSLVVRSDAELGLARGLMVAVYVDRDDRLRPALRAQRDLVVVLLVRADGRLSVDPKVFRPQARLETDLRRLAA
jgi:hypothetical protein